MEYSRKKSEAKPSETYDLNRNGIIDSGEEAKMAADEISKKISTDSGIWKIIILLKATIAQFKSSEDYNSLKLKFHDKGEEEKILQVSPKVLEEIVDNVLNNPKLRQGNKKMDSVDLTEPASPSATLYSSTISKFRFR
ncbi:MAG: hypothetical protein ABL867_02015 [Rickettsiales bacterium]